MSTYKIERDAVLKLLLHAAKYASSSVTGLLLGTTTNGIHIKDVVPLFHNSFTLADSTEVALVQLEAYAQQENLALLGCYYADAHISNNDLHPALRKVADKILEKSPQSCALLVDNKKLGLFMNAAEPCPVDLMLKELNGKVGWRKVLPSGQGPKLVLEPGSLAQLRDAFAALLKHQAHRLLHDFDDHLDDISKDYLNQELVKVAVASAVA